MKKFIKVVRLVSNIFLGVDSEKRHEYTFEKFFEVVWLFQKFYEMQNSKTFMNTPSKKFFEVVRLISNILLGVDSKKSHEYTFAKII